MRRAWIVKTTDEDRVPLPGVYESARQGFARIGWSSADELDLRLLSSPPHPLTDDQKTACRCLRFLTDIKENDLLVYPRQPDYAQFFVCQALGDYQYLPEDMALNGDFRSAHKCDIVLQPMSVDDPRVPQLLARRMRLPGRLNELYDVQLLEDLIDHIDAGVTEDASARIRRRMRRKSYRQFEPSIQIRCLREHYCQRCFAPWVMRISMSRKGPARQEATWLSPWHRRLFRENCGSAFRVLHTKEKWHATNSEES